MKTTPIPTLYEIKEGILPALASAVVSMIAAVGFGMLSGLGAEAGLVTSAIFGFIAGYFGGADLIIRATTGAIVIIVADMLSRITQIPGMNYETTIFLLIIAFMVAGLVQYLIGHFQFGSAIFYVPQSIIKGFISGVGVLIIFAQLNKILGLNDFYQLVDLTFYQQLLKQLISGYGLLFFSTYLLMKFGHKIIPKIPALLTATIVGIIIQLLFRFDIEPIAKVDTSSYLSNLTQFWIAIGTVSFKVPNNIGPLIFDLLLFGFTIAFIASIDALMISVAAERMGQKNPDPNQELRAQGIGNAISAVFLGLPGSAIMGGTVVNIRSGAKTKWAGILSSLLILVLLLTFKDIVFSVPAVVIDTIILLVGFQLVDWAFIKNLNRVPINDRVVFGFVLIVTVTFNLIYAILIGFSIASIVFMKKMSDVITEESDSATYDNSQKKLISLLEKDISSEGLMQKIEVKQIKGPLFFGVTNNFAKSLKSLSKEVKYVLLNFQLVPYIDFSGVDELIQLKKELKSQKIRLIFCGLNQEASQTLSKFGLITTENRSDIRPTIESALLMIHLFEQELSELIDEEGIIQTVLNPEDEKLAIWKADKWIQSHQPFEILDKRQRIVHSAKGDMAFWNGKFKGKIPCPTGLYTFRVYEDDEKVNMTKEGIFAIV